MSTFSYLRNLLHDRSIASVTPSSRYTVERVCKSLDLSKAHLIVEYGPGLGVFTEYLLRRLRKDASLVVFETNESFARALERRLEDPRLVVIHESAEEVSRVLAERRLPAADAVISGIPFSMLELTAKQTIIGATAAVLKDDGQFLTYQVFPPPASLDRHLRKFLEPEFEVVRVEYEFRNIPPLRIYESRKRRAQ